jgi:hypothetical protein
MRQKGGGFSELPGGQLALAGQRILHRLRQAAEKMSVEEGVGVRRKQGLHVGEQREHMPIAERRVIYEPETLSNISLSVAVEKRLLEAAVGSDGPRRHHANQVANSGDDVRRESAQDVAVADIAVGREVGNVEFRFRIVKPANRVLLPERRQHKAVGGGGWSAVCMKRLRQGLYRGSGGDGGLRSCRLIHLHHCIA